MEGSSERAVKVPKFGKVRAKLAEAHREQAEPARRARTLTGRFLSSKGWEVRT